MIQAFLLVGLLLSSCALNNTKNNSQALLGLPQYWLTTSMYAGISHDRSSLIMLDAGFFDATHIIPAGTLVQISDVKYRQSENSAQFWVYLKIARERGQVSIFRENIHALVIPDHIKTKDELKIYLTNFMSKKDPHQWVLKSRAYIQEAIYKKEPVIGMSRRELLAAMGPARKKQSQKNLDTNNPQEIWHYLDYFVLLDNQEVTKVKKLSSKALAKK